VSGHGASSAMITGMVKQAFRAAEKEHFAPASVLERIAAASRLFPGGKYVTATVVRFSPESPLLEYASAGHPPGLLLRHDGSLELLEPSAPIIHPALPHWECEQRVVRMEAGDQLLLYTDGFTEAQNTDGDEFGFDRLAALVPHLAMPESAVGAPRPDLLGTVRQELARFAGGRPLTDDLTLALVRRL
jgi:sigma-B regulation protein RsbU (phosphoserine phosphatase)